jgi:hypothetical protein
MVYVREYSAVTRALDWLMSGQHPFSSVILDSVSEMQQRCVDNMVGTNPMKQQDWGQLLRIVSDTIRKFRDLITHPTHPLWAVVFIAMTGERTSKWKPLVQGALRDTLPYYVDVCGYMFIDQPLDGPSARRLLVAPNAEFEAGERVGGVLGAVIDNPTIPWMLSQVINAMQANQQGAPQ